MGSNPALVWHHALVTRGQRERLNGHRGCMLWFTGLSSSGKSSIAHAVEERLHRRGCRTFVLDGDNIRQGLCADLDFSASDRAENLRRIGEVGKLFLEAGTITLAAFISPSRIDGERVRALFAPGEFMEIYCECPVAACERRDVKGMYRRARAGEIQDFTGVSAPYEPPQRPDLVLPTAELPIDECVERVLALIERQAVLPDSPIPPAVQPAAPTA